MHQTLGYSFPSSRSCGYLYYPRQTDREYQNQHPRCGEHPRGDASTQSPDTGRLDERNLRHEHEGRPHGRRPTCYWFADIYTMVYSDAKAIDETLTRSYFVEYGLKTTVVRLFNTVGPRQSGRYG